MRSAIIDACSAIRFVLGRPALLFRFGFWPLIAAIVMAMVFNGLAGVVMGLAANLPGTSGTASLGTFMFLGGLPWAGFSAVFAVRWHRLVLIGEDQASGFDAAFSQRVGHFFAWLCLLDLVLVVVAMGLFLPVMNALLYLSFLVPARTGLLDVIWSAGVLLAAVALACAAYAFLLSQIALIFPAIAVEKPASFRSVWRMGAGRRLRNFLTLFFVTLAPAVILTLVLEVVASLSEPAKSVQLVTGGARATMLAETSSPIETVLTIVIGIGLYIVTVATTAVALSNLYRAATDPPSEHGSATEQDHG